MEFELNKKENTENNLTEEDLLKSHLDISYNFAKHMKQEFNDFIKGIILFGSSAKKKSTGKSDVDILVILDDLSIEMTAEVVESYRIITEKIISKVSPRLHVTTLKYVTFWKYARDAHPVAVNILRDGVPIIDTGFFAPLQQLFRRGEIKPSLESIMDFFARSSDALHNVKVSLLHSTLGLYWAVVDSAQALLMMHNFVSPSPEHVSKLIESKLLPKNILERKHIEVIDEFFSLSKLITHNKINYISGKDFDEYYKKAYSFVSDVKKELEKME